MSTGYRGLAALCVAIALLVAGTAAAGVLLRGDGATDTAVSIRGEEYEYATGGVYAYNPERVVAEGVGWDVVTLVFAAPALLFAAVSIARGSLRARLFAIGLLAYFFYQYLMYAVFWALGPLFPLFIVAYAASAAAIVWLARTIEIEHLAQDASERFPRKGMTVFCGLVALLLCGMWIPRIATGLSGDFSGAGLFGMPTLTVQAMDLGMLVPLAVTTGVLVWRSRPWGYLLATVFVVKGVTMAAAICAMLVSAALTDGALEIAPFAIFAAATAAAGFLALRMFRALPAGAGSPTRQ